MSEVKKIKWGKNASFSSIWGTSKDNKTAYKFLQETINHMAQNNNSINKTETNNLRAHTPSPLLKGQNHPEINQQVQIKTKKW